MDLFEFISKHFWVMFIIVTFANAIIMKIRSKKYFEADPSLKSGYDTIFKGIITWGNIPWIIMGAGIITGHVPSIFQYFRPQDGNPFVIAFFISIFLIWILGTYWLFVKDGAEILVKHPGIFNYNFSSPTIVKLFWILCLAGGVAGVAMMFTMNAPLPNFR
jgi:hypothetical protein